MPGDNGGGGELEVSRGSKTAAIVNDLQLRRAASRLAVCHDRYAVDCLDDVARLQGGRHAAEAGERM